MKALNSGRAPATVASIAGFSVLAVAAILLLSYAPFFSFAAGTTVTVSSAQSSYPTGAAGTAITISGTVSPAPGTTGSEATVSIANNVAGVFVVNSTAVNPTTGAFGLTFVSTSSWAAGVYTVTATWAAGAPPSPAYQGTSTFTYGNVSTTTTSTTSATPNSNITTITVVNSTTIIVSSVTTFVTTVIQGSTVTSIITQETTTTISAVGNSTLGEIIGIVGIIIAVIAGGIAALALRKH